MIIISVLTHLAFAWHPGVVPFPPSFLGVAENGQPHSYSVSWEETVVKGLEPGVWVDPLWPAAPVQTLSVLREGKVIGIG